MPTWRAPTWLRLSRRHHVEIVFLAFFSAFPRPNDGTARVGSPAIPETLLEAAKIDGAGIFTIFTRIMIPLSIPAFVVVFIWQFTSAWNDFLFAVVLTNTEHWPVTVALNNLAGSQIIAWNVQMAASFIAAVPTLLVYIFLGRYFLRGMMSGALKE